MTVPFGPLPGDPDVEGVNTLLDEMLAGLPVSSSTSAASDEALALIDGVRRLAVLARRSDAAAVSYLDTDPPGLRWEEVLHTAYPPRISGWQDANMPTFSPRRSSVRYAASGNRARHRAMPAFAILLLLLATFTGGWLLGQWSSGAADNPTSQFATATGDESTPFSTAYSAPDGDLSYVSPPICEIAALSIDAGETFCEDANLGLRNQVSGSMAQQLTGQWH